MPQYIDKDALVAEIEKLKDYAHNGVSYHQSRQNVGLENELSTWKHLEITFATVLKIIDTLEVKEVGLIIHTIIAECCDWLAMNTNLIHDEIEGCRNLMLTVKDEQLKSQKGE